VALSTTLATNAIVEGRGCPVCLLLIGYDPTLIRQYGFEHDPAAAALLTRALGNAARSDLGCKFKLNKPLVALGAPVEA
jgi:N-methylhydantoinase A/oxoprolinase/acetone carboxylase beta subunit